MSTQTTDNPSTPASVHSSEWLEVWGTRYPIIKDLKQGWYLIAHPNGPAISTGAFGYLGSLAYQNKDVPELVRRDAIKALADWAQRQPSYPRNRSQA
jgi:hypothetical protein